MWLFGEPDKRIRTRWQKVASQCRCQLTAQRIAPGEPGTILSDIGMLLDYVGPVGIVTGSGNASFPAERLPELNARLSHPIKLILKRALLRDYPNLAGLFILLRVMGLLGVNRNRLAVCPEAMEFWRTLNPTEQYFALLESLLFHAHSSVLGRLHTREDAEAFESVTFFLVRLSDRWRPFDEYESTSTFGPHGEIPPWNLFLQQQFGLIELRQRTPPDRDFEYGGRGWLAGSAKLTTWGTAIAWALHEYLAQELQRVDQEDQGFDESFEPVQIEFGSSAGEVFHPAEPAGILEPGAEAAAESDGLETEPQFGLLQPVFQPYFPEWKTVYARPRRQLPKGAYIFKVTLGGWRGCDKGLWRRLAVPAEHSLDSLAGAILDAFDEDHMYDFRYRDHSGKDRAYYHPESREGPWTPEITLAQTDLPIKSELLFTFDYGDNWKFKLRLEKIDPELSRLNRPKLIASAGKAPKQYPDYE